MTRSNEQGIALILAMFMVLVLSTISVSLMFVSQTETWSSQNYKMMSQARYAAESGVHAAANHLMFAYVPPGTNAADPLVGYDMTKAPVIRAGGAAVFVTSVEGAASNYPVDAVRDAFIANSRGTLANDNGSARYRATARMLSMQQITPAYSTTPVTLVTWEITGIGGIDGARSAETEVSANLLEALGAVRRARGGGGRPPAGLPVPPGRRGRGGAPAGHRVRAPHPGAARRHREGSTGRAPGRPSGRT